MACPAGPAPISPSNLVVTKLDQHTLRLRWTSPGVSFDGYNLEGSVNGGPFSRINTDLVPASWATAVLGLSDNMPELLRLDFRLTCVVGSQPAGPPATAIYNEPLLTPQVFAGAAPGGIELLLTSDSRRANHYHVERLDGKVTVDLPIAVNIKWLDENVEEDVGYVYRVTVSDGVHSSEPSTTQSISLGVRAPMDLAARSVDAGHIELTWTNRSPKATDCVIHRWTGPTQVIVPDLAHVSPAANRFDDAVPAPGVYGYQLICSAPGTTDTGLSLPTLGITAPSGDLPMSARVLPLPRTTVFASDGTIFTAEEAAGASYPNQGPWTLTAPSGETLQTGADQEFHGFVLDGSGRVHTLLQGEPDPTTLLMPLEHVWFDGSRWSRQPVGTAPFGRPPTIAISSSGGLQLAWYSGDPPALTVVEEQSDGGLLVTQPDAGSSNLLSGPQLVMGQERPHVLYSVFLGGAQSTVFYDVSPDFSQVWSVTGLSVAGRGIPLYTLAPLGQADGSFELAFVVPGPTGMPELDVSRWSETGWNPPERVGEVSVLPDVPPGVIGTFRGTETALATPDSLFTRRDVSGWAHNTLTPVLDVYFLPSQMGYFTDGGLFVLVPIDSSNVALFVEER